MLGQSSQKALDEIRKETKGRRKIVFVSGFFNIVHPGHLRLLRFAAECGDYLVVGVYDDASGNSLLDEKIRLDGISTLSLVDHSFILDDKIDIFIRELKPHIVVKGMEHEHTFNIEEAAVAAYGGKLLFSSGDMSFSLSELLQDESQRIVLSGLKKHDGFMQRRDITWQDLDLVLKKFQELNVLVIGEVIVDEYINCESLGMSREDPTLVVSPIKTDKYLGGAGIVAAHASNLGAKASFFSVTGANGLSGFVKEKLKEYNVHGYLYKDESRPTILKQRFRSHSKTLLRVNHLRQHPISKDIQKNILDDLLTIIDRQDVIVFSDFNYGCLPQPLVDTIIRQARKKGVMMVADSQSSSQVGDVSRFTHTKLLTPTEREARLALKDFESGLVVLAEKLRKKAAAENVIITLNEEGMLIHAGNAGNFFTDKIAAMNTNPVDPAGAGDSLLTCSALALAAGSDIWQGAYLGAVAAACQVGRNGNIPLSVNDLYVETRT